MEERGKDELIKRWKSGWKPITRRNNDNNDYGDDENDDGRTDGRTDGRVSVNGTMSREGNQLRQKGAKREAERKRNETKMEWARESR